MDPGAEKLFLASDRQVIIFIPYYTQPNKVIKDLKSASPLPKVLLE
ncbi:MAG: hypothetical protein GFH24_608434n25 [Chloroflexi bacterium AL-N5]|nr:hypothetical protein [Chloroflexi bacterium AL-N5]